MLPTITSDLLGNAFGLAGRSGWATVDTASTPAEIGSVVAAFGAPRHSRDGRLGVERLSPGEACHGPSRSLTGRYGLSAFPFHSDGAHWKDPPGWVVMWAEIDESGRDTLVMSWHTVRALAREPAAATFLIRNGRRSFYVSVSSRAHLDLDCMVPQDDAARRLVAGVERAADRREFARIQWQPGRVVVLDNRMVLHARGAADVPSAKRVIWRALLAGRLVA